MVTLKTRSQDFRKARECMRHAVKMQAIYARDTERSNNLSCRCRAETQGAIEVDASVSSTCLTAIHSRPSTVVRYPLETHKLIREPTESVALPLFERLYVLREQSSIRTTRQRRAAHVIQNTQVHEATVRRYNLQHADAWVCVGSRRNGSM